VVLGGRCHEWVDAGDGDDTLFGGGGNDVVHAGAGQGIVFGGAGDDCLHGEDGADLLFGGRGHDYLNGGRGRDLLIGGDGRDVIKGGQGNDLLIGGRLKTDWESLFDKSLLDTAIAEWATGDLADTMMILGAVIDDDEPDYLFGQQGGDTLIAGRRDARWQ